jgi:hypothetical protein
MNLQHIGSDTPTPGLLAHRALTHGSAVGARLAPIAPPVTEPARLAIVARPKPASANRAELRAHALLAQDVYNDRASPPAGYRTASAQDLQALRLDPGMLKVGDLRARVYVTGSGDDVRYTIAFRGTEGQGDWIANAQQGTGNDSLHYRQALVIGQRIRNSPLASRVDFTGHSLGGGLASAAAVASGRRDDRPGRCVLCQRRGPVRPAGRRRPGGRRAVGRSAGRRGGRRAERLWHPAQARGSAPGRSRLA